MFPNPDDDDSMSVRLSRTWRWIAAFALVCILGALPWWLRETGTNRELTPAGVNVRAGTSEPVSSTEGTSDTAGAVGTSGFASDVREAAVDTGIIRELGAVTGSTRGLIGRRISLAVPVHETANDNAFWVGSGKNRMLVVIHRDRRNDIQRQDAAAAVNGIAPVDNGQNATITGTIQRIPSPEEMSSWGLTSKDKAELSARPIYIRADTVEPSA